MLPHGVTKDNPKGHEIHLSQISHDTTQGVALFTTEAIQGFGLLFVLGISEESENLIVQAVSDNSHRFTGKTPGELLSLKSFTSIIDETQINEFVERVTLLESREAHNVTDGFEAFMVSMRVSQEESKEFWCVMHRTDADANSVICEFELPENERTTKQPGCSPLRYCSDVKPGTAQPENDVHSVRRRKRPPMGRIGEKKRYSSVAMDTLNTISRVQDRLARAPDVKSLLKVAVETVKEITGFDHVMTHQFDEEFNVRVVSEHSDTETTKTAYIGQTFPASGFTRECGESHKLNKLRILYDREISSAQLVCSASKTLQHPLNLTYAYLRAMSDDYLRSLADLSVRSSASISISLFNRAWGMITCHSYGLQGLLMSFPVRRICYLLSDMVSRNIEKFSYNLQLKAKNMITTLPTLRNSSGRLSTSLEPLLHLLQADFGILSIRNTAHAFGSLDRPQDALVVLTYLRLKTVTSVLTSTNIKVDFVDLRCPFELRSLGGVLVVPLSNQAKDFVVFFRKRQLKESEPTGDLDKKLINEGFKGDSEFRTTTRAQCETLADCQEWTEVDIEVASVFALVYARLLEVWGHDQAVLQSSKLTQLLLANSAHEIRTPLNAVINYLELALEGSLDKRVRKRLEKSQRASKCLLHFVHELLKLIPVDVLGR